jgi:hypothetical protein
MVKMSDNTKTVMLTEREIDLVLQCIGTNIETVKRRHPMTGSTADLVQELAEMDMDIREQVFRDDGWDDPEDPDLFMDPVDFAVKHDAETQMFNAGVDAREKIKAKASSRAQERRTFNIQRGRDSRLSETQTHDVWDDNDPKNW